MTSSAALWTVSISILLLNLPFGFWRAGVPKFSRSWFLAVHLPVPFAIGLRFLVGMGFRLRLLPIFVGVYFAGQLLGGRARRVLGAGVDSSQDPSVAKNR